MPRTTKATADPTTVVGYVRVSTDEQADSGLGLASQRSAIRAECSRRGWTLLAIHEDAGISGKSTTNRPGLTEALAAVENREAGGIVVAKLDRLSRSLADFANLMARAQAAGWNLVALDLGVDLTSAAGEFMANVMASAAQWERRIIGQRTRDALAVKRAQGVRLGRPVTLADELRSRIVADHAAGESLSSIARSLNDEAVPTAHGGARWYPSTVRAVVMSTVPAEAA
jgi:DNA invertase Pin-like site-specific DNA recombinase